MNSQGNARAVLDCKNRSVPQWGDGLVVVYRAVRNCNTTCPLTVHIFKRVLDNWTGHRKTLTAFWVFPWMEWLEKHKRRGRG